MRERMCVLTIANSMDTLRLPVQWVGSGKSSERGRFERFLWRFVTESSAGE